MINLKLIFRSLAHSEMIFKYVVMLEYNFLPFACAYPVVYPPFMEKLLFPHLDILVENWLAIINVCLFLDSQFYFIGLPHSFVVIFEIAGRSEPSNISLLLNFFYKFYFNWQLINVYNYNIECVILVYVYFVESLHQTN